MNNEDNARGEIKEWINAVVCDDPYWRVLDRYVDSRRLEPIIREFDLFEQQYPMWADHLYSGLPTYYGVLCITKDASSDMLKEAYDKKKRYSTYPKDVIDEAYNVLSKPELRAKYGKLLQLFEKMSRSIPSKEKNEIKKYHEEWLKREEEGMERVYMALNHPEWISLMFMEAPTFYRILGVDKDKSQEEIKEVYESERRIRYQLSTLELLEEVYGVLSDQQLRSEYDFVLNSFEDIPENVLDEIRGEQKLIGQKMDDDKILSHIKLHRWKRIMDKHHDWKSYLPPNEETFYDVLGIDISKLPINDKDVEKEIRDNYRGMEKTSIVNLAYSVLKNSNLREEYKWMLKNHEGISGNNKRD